ncbi:ABC transporter ATP-binding protein [Alicyclobacillus sp. SO9]|uniref:ABC transporter ATP-binding protein n=1 Tax=Alicyclobacillus sp. SO9 TaxID=2665646 RepID=UPI0018E79BFF|nr:ABC transporter ATP-binding protein [Alicyclobacillus sp. SO9]QQE79786.1 ABC transporter ATP-binding protein [Alicyclobacillus sp. SO9]
MIEVENLSVTYKSKHRVPVTAVRNVSFTIHDNEFVGLVGESGCGKSTLGYAMANLLDDVHHDIKGRVLLDGTDLLSLPEKKMRLLRWAKIAVVLQGGMNAFNPVIKLKHQFMDGMKAHTKMTKAEMGHRITSLLELVKLEPEVADMYPHELSGGMKQRAAIALALSLNPEVIIMDEPTTALDVVVQHSIVNTLTSLQRQLKFSVLFITHDLGVVLEAANKIMVMYAGQTVEHNSAEEILKHPRHPYTEALMGCYVDPQSDNIQLSGIPGAPPDLSLALSGCPFAPRCTKVFDTCLTVTPPNTETTEGSVLCHLYSKEGVPQS